MIMTFIINRRALRERPKERHLTTAVGKPCPEFEIETMTSGELGRVKLADYAGKHAVILFYPLDFTFVCPTELMAFSDRLDDFAALGAEVLGVSVDSKFTHLAWWKTPIADGGIAGCRLSLGGDVSRRMSEAFGVLNGEGVALRALFVIDREGIVRHKTVNDLPIGRNVEETLRVIAALRHHEEHGEVCPANWRPGQRSMTPETGASRSYFAHAASERSA